MELFDIVDEHGIPTGETVERSIAHRDGIRHRSEHVWIARHTPTGVEVDRKSTRLNSSHD